MLDIKQLLADPEASVKMLLRRDPTMDLSELLRVGEARKAAAARFGTIRHEQKQTSQAFGRNKDLSDEQRTEVRAKLKELSSEVKEIESELKELEERLHAMALDFPNIPDPATPEGHSEADNVVVRSWGTPRQHTDEMQEHHELAEQLGLVDFEAGAKISGSRFVVYRGNGARMERALANFMLDLHGRDHGYEEMLPPFLVQRSSMVGTGQLPKFEEDAFHCTADDLFLIPTAEVPITNIHREEILESDQLPKRYVAFSACFRREAGSYGKDTRGLTRLHQFQKVEMVHITKAEESEAAHEAMVAHAEAVLQALELPYRVVELCAGDMGFSARRCYDLEVWLPGQNQWREISSCSNCGDFQARRASIRYRPAKGEKPRFAHTLNGSGVAIGRTVMAILENHQLPDGSIKIPEALVPYMGTSMLENKGA